LGDSDGTLNSYMNVLQLRQQVDAVSADWKDRLSLARAYRLLAHQQSAMGKRHEARSNIDEAILLAESLNRAHPYTPEILYEVGFSHEVSGAIAYPGDPQEHQKKLEDYRQALAAGEASLTIQPEDVRTLHAIAVDTSYIGQLLHQTDPRAALPYYEKALEINRQLTHRSTEIQYVRSVAIAYGNIADVYADLGDYARQVANNKLGLEIYQDLDRRDPKNALVRQGLAIAYVNTASALSTIGEFEEALRDVVKGIEIMRGLVTSAPKTSAQKSILAAMLVANGTILTLANHPKAARPSLEEARTLFQSLSEPDDPGLDTAACDVKLGQAAAAGGSDQDAAKYFRRALQVVEPFTKKDDADLEALYAGADAYAGLGQLDGGEDVVPEESRYVETYTTP
jgi:tetratricopeptide (TPR) repeat protein